MIVHFVTHPEVVIDPSVPVVDWSLSPVGLARMRAAVRRPWATEIGAVFSSTERKAREAAAVLGAARGLPVRAMAALGENDRAATGYLPRAAFEAQADAFFAQPCVSVRGWERACDAQLRIIAAVDQALAAAPAAGDVAIVAHGAVGTLMLCHLMGAGISRALEQPGEGGGNRFAFERSTRRLFCGWTRIEA